MKQFLKKAMDDDKICIEIKKEIKIEKAENFNNNNLMSNLHLEILDSLKNNLEKNKEYENKQKSLIELYENIFAKLKKDLIEAPEELNKEKTESEQLNAHDENLFEKELEDIQENINELKTKYEEEVKKNIKLNETNEKYKKEIDEKKEKIEILQNDKKEIIQQYEDILNARDLKIMELIDKLDKEKRENNEIYNLQENIKEIKSKYEDKLKSKEEEIKICMSKTSKIKEQFNEMLKNIEDAYKKKLEEESKKIEKTIKQTIEINKQRFKDELEKIEKNYDTKLNDLKNIIENQLLNNKDDNYNDSDSDSDSDKDDLNNNEIHLNEIEIEKQKEIIIEKIPLYSFECINKKELKININENSDFSKFEVALKNNGSLRWHENTKLKIVGPSGMIITKILKPQEPKTIGIYPMNLNDLKRNESGEYIIYLEFYSDGKNYGERLEIKVNTVKTDDIIKNIEKINKVREFSGLDERNYSNERIWCDLKANDFNVAKTVDSIFKKS